MSLPHCLCCPTTTTNGRTVGGGGGGGGGGVSGVGGGRGARASRGVIYAYEEINWRLTDQTRGGGVIIHGAETGLFRTCAWGLM